MNVIKEWFCAEHGDFDASHPICPALGCESGEVIRVFRTPVAVKSDVTRRTDAGLRKTADMYHQADFKSAKREGDSSKAHNQADMVLWGDKGTEFLQKPLTAAAAPASFDIKTPEGPRRWTDFGGLPTVANESPLLKGRSPLPTAERLIAGNDSEARKKITQQ